MSEDPSLDSQKPWTEQGAVGAPRYPSNKGMEGGDKQTCRPGLSFPKQKGEDSEDKQTAKAVL